MKMVYAHRIMKPLIVSVVSLVFATSLVAQEADALFDLPPLEISDNVKETVPPDTTLNAVSPIDIIGTDSVKMSAVKVKTDTAIKTTQRMYNDTVIPKIQISSTPIEPEAPQTSGAAMPVMLQRTEAKKPTISKIASEVAQDTTAMKTQGPTIKVVTTEDMAALGQKPAMDPNIAKAEAEKEAKQKVADAKKTQTAQTTQVTQTASTTANKKVTTTASPRTQTQPQAQTKAAASTTSKKPSVAGQIYRVQVFALQNESPQALKEIKKQVGEKTEVSVLSENGMKKYVAGSFKSYDEAAQFRNTLAEKGFKGCFVVAYSNGKRVSF